jgi:tetratricopeptide (TPR) repeat protein
LASTNLSDHSIVLGDWQKTLTLEFLHTYRKQEEKHTNISATLVIRKQLEWSETSGTQKGYLRPAVTPNSKGELNPHASLRYLMLFEPDRALPCGDYILSVSMAIQNRRICSGQIFRVREAINQDDRAKMYKMESIAFGLLGNVKSELERLCQAAKEVPESPWTWYHLGEYYKAAGDFQSAKDAFREGAKRFPISPQKAAERTGQGIPLMEIPQTDGDLLYGEICFEVLLADIERQQSK